MLKLSATRRLLIGEDGQRVDHQAQDWRDGNELVALIDVAIPDERTGWMRIE